MINFKHIFGFCAVPMLAVLTLAGCSLQSRVGSVPQVLLQNVTVQGNTATARALLQNFTLKPETYSQLDYQLQFDGVPAASGSSVMNIEVPPESPENIDLTLSLSPAASAALAGSKPIAYTLRGTLTSSKPSRTYTLDYQGTLSPTPGKPGSWR